jgi:hypothetical protein
VPAAEGIAREIAGGEQLSGGSLGAASYTVADSSLAVGRLPTGRGPSNGAAAANFAATFQGDRLEEIAGHLEAIFNVVSGVAAKFS